MAFTAEERKERMREASRRHYAKNREKLLERAAQWHRDNPEKAREKQERYNAKTRPAGSAWQSWKGMIDRCTHPSHQAWRHYGGRGITVCDRWLPAAGGSFANFLADMGERPPGLTLERIDNDGNYEPSNCCWASRTEQIRNSHARGGELQ